MLLMKSLINHFPIFLDEILTNNNTMKAPSYTEINKNFLIRVEDSLTKKTSIHSARTYVLLLGDSELAHKHFNEVLRLGKDKQTINLRRGLKIDFVSKSLW